MAKLPVIFGIFIVFFLKIPLSYGELPLDSGVYPADTTSVATLSESDSVLLRQLQDSLPTISSGTSFQFRVSYFKRITLKERSFLWCWGPLPESYSLLIFYPDSLKDEMKFLEPFDELSVSALYQRVNPDYRNYPEFTLAKMEKYRFKNKIFADAAYDYLLGSYKIKEYFVSNYKTYIYSDKSAEQEKKGVLKFGEKVMVVADYYQWMMILWGQDSTGWIRADHVLRPSEFQDLKKTIQATGQSLEQYFSVFSFKDSLDEPRALQAGQATPARPDSLIEKKSILSFLFSSSKSKIKKQKSDQVPNLKNSINSVSKKTGRKSFNKPVFTKIVGKEAKQLVVKLDSTQSLDDSMKVGSILKDSETPGPIIHSDSLFEPAAEENQMDATAASDTEQTKETVEEEFFLPILEEADSSSWAVDFYDLERKLAVDTVGQKKQHARARYVIGLTAKVYSEPNGNLIQDTLQFGEEVYFYKAFQAWHRITYRNQKYGWVEAHQLTSDRNRMKAIRGNLNLVPQ